MRTSFTSLDGDFISYEKELFIVKPFFFFFVKKINQGYLCLVFQNFCEHMACSFSISSKFC